MATVHLPRQLRDLADGSAEIDVQGARVIEVIAALERAHPRMTGRVRDEQGILRPHVKVFVNGEVAALEDPVTATDVIRILPAISGGDVR